MLKKLRKYTQAGDRVRAIKCLVKSGDTKAVIQFATITRNNEIFKLGHFFKYKIQKHFFFTV